MKKTILLTGLLFWTFFAVAQSGSWRIRVNSKTILSTRQEDVAKNVKKISSAEWKKSGNLEILFAEDEKNIWMRYFHLVDEFDNEIIKKDSTTHAKISLAELRKLFTGKKQIKVYTTISPLDPNIAIRMRRVHLCTLQLP